MIDVIEASARFDQKPRLIENAGVKCEFSRLVLNLFEKPLPLETDSFCAMACEGYNP